MIVYDTPWWCVHRLHGHAERRVTGPAVIWIIVGCVDDRGSLHRPYMLLSQRFVGGGSVDRQLCCGGIATPRERREGS
jgi:hypothetical protein